MFNLYSRSFWLRFIPIVVVLSVDIFFLVFLDNYFYIKKSEVIKESLQDFSELQNELFTIKNELNKIAKSNNYTSLAKSILEKHADEIVFGDGPWLRISLSDKEGETVFLRENLDKLYAFNNWNNSLFSLSYIGQVGIADLQLLVEFATPPGFEAIDDLALKYKVYAILFVILSWVVYLSLSHMVIQPLINIDEGIERIIRTGNVSLIDNPRNETERAFNQLMRTQREVFFGLEVDQTVDQLHHISDDTEAVSRFLLEMTTRIPKVYPFPKVEASLCKQNQWLPIMDTDSGKLLSSDRDASIAIDETHTLHIQLNNNGNKIGALSCTLPESFTDNKEEEIECMGREIEKQASNGIARCVGRSRTLTEERNRFGINIATNMGHDLTNIIASGKWDLDTINRAQKLGIIQTDEQRGKYYEEAVNGLGSNLHFLQEMVDIYRSFAHTQSPRFELTDVALLTQDLVNLFTQSTSKKLSIEVSTPETLETVVEPRLLRMALFNLLNNAAQAIAQSDPPIEDGKIWVALKREGTTALFELRDNGPGIRDQEKNPLPDTQINRIFQSGYSTKGKSSGGGLGLSWVRSIIEDFHDGTISAKNHPEGGAVFLFSIPVQINPQFMQ